VGFNSPGETKEKDMNWDDIREKLKPTDSKAVARLMQGENARRYVHLILSGARTPQRGAKAKQIYKVCQKYVQFLKTIQE